MSAAGEAAAKPEIAAELEKHLNRRQREILDRKNLVDLLADQINWRFGEGCEWTLAELTKAAGEPGQGQLLGILVRIHKSMGGTSKDPDPSAMGKMFREKSDTTRRGFKWYAAFVSKAKRTKANIWTFREIEGGGHG